VLLNLHALVYENSVTAFLKRRDLLVQYPSYDVLPESIPLSKMQEISAAVSDEDDTSALKIAYRYIEYYKILERIRDTLQLLLVCKAETSSLCVTPSRLEVAELCKSKFAMWWTSLSR
jgi:hypothetical protein